ncbi:NAD(P)-dependent oxidoreductase [Polynucleobacter sp. Adler-ghost]|uniref:NAD-dependent epimerase/dehydratase family protein n=1 Tax=Polynucleobacter sp. Adler-ghost TaxID=2770234 RepID=UPI001BFE61C9|nr:NAD(P)-dependent oxidoreductase [Polynucleobacter sp. Adler-ghost]QWE31068.1 NAD(P)-dependent oxidoreductase [Polynucleobacter sp. Adler-ghost]
MKIGILGGSGFIGTRLFEKLLQCGYKPTIFDKVVSKSYPLNTIQVDIRDYDELQKAINDFDCIINLAAEHADNVSPSSLYEEVNVLGATNLCRALHVNSIKKLIFTSSVAVYGLNSEILNESARLSPFNEYGISKLRAEEVYKNWQELDEANNSLTIIRPTVVFGEGNRGNLYNLMNHIYHNKFIMIGKGDNKKSIAYVGNLVDFILHSLACKSGTHIYNYSDEPIMKVSDLVKLIHEAFGIKMRFRFYIPELIALVLGKLLDNISEISGINFPISEVRVKKFCSDTIIMGPDKCLNFRPQFTLDQAILKTIQAEFVPKRINPNG